MSYLTQCESNEVDIEFTTTQIIDYFNDYFVVMNKSYSNACMLANITTGSEAECNKSFNGLITNGLEYFSLFVVDYMRIANASLPKESIMVSLGT